MLVRLFDIVNGQVVPTEHCYTLAPLKEIMDNYPDNYLGVYKYLQYMTCIDPDANPFLNSPEDEKEELILEYIKADFSTEDDLIQDALKLCFKLHDTPTYRAYRGIKAMLDKLAKYMESTAITSGRDGNGSFLLKAATEFKDIRASYKAAYNDLKEEQGVQTRGGTEKAYDQ